MDLYWLSRPGFISYNNASTQIWQRWKKNYASRHRNPDFDFEWACVSICICKGEEIREAIKTFDLDQ